MLELGELERLRQNRARERGERAFDLGVANDGAGNEGRPIDELRPVHVDPLEEVESTLVAQPDVDEHCVDIGMTLEDRDGFLARTRGKDGMTAASEPRC